MSKIAVVAIGGNSLIRDKNHQSVEDQYKTLVNTCSHLSKLIELGYEIVITHGNGPQVGFILLKSELAKYILPEVPLDSCNADTQGGIGYNIQRALVNEFRRKNIKKEVATVITQVVVSPDDPAFKNPTKPIGPFYTKEQIKEKGNWIIREDAGRGYRQVVPSPIPRKIIELEAIKNLLNAGFVVIAAGGGGIPVIEKNGKLEGIEAVIDKDYASSLLASELKAELLLISTAVEKVSLNFNSQNEYPIDKMSVKEAKKYLQEGQFAEGSMAPKIRACIAFIEHKGKEALITAPETIEKALNYETGTRITA
ncbi:carbamate kinase [candidate division WOR-3 bacterium]|nr:carbamate kinase [candidate division WOR-3 bacterium]